MTVNAYDIGDSVSASVTFTNFAGTPTNPTTVTITVRDPDGAVTNPGVTNYATGAYYATWNATKAGRWNYRFVGTGALQAAAEGSIDVRPNRTAATTGSLLVSPRLLEQSFGTEFDAADYQLAEVILATVEDEVRGYLNRPLNTETITETHRLLANDERVYLNRSPVIAVASVGIRTMPNGTATTLDPASYWVRSWGVEIGVGKSDGELVITYTAGLFAKRPDAEGVVKSVILRVARRELQRTRADMVGLNGISVEGSSYTPVIEGLSEHDRRILRRYRRPAAFGGER